MITGSLGPQPHFALTGACPATEVSSATARPPSALADVANRSLSNLERAGNVLVRMSLLRERVLGAATPAPDKKPISSPTNGLVNEMSATVDLTADVLMCIQDHLNALERDLT